MKSVESSTIERLNSLLRGEIAAVETYRQAIDRLKITIHRPELMACLQSHEVRVALLTEHVRKLGGAPAASSGVWGAFAKLVQGSASALGEKAAIAAIDEGEDLENKEYQSDLSYVDPMTRSFIETRVIPLQRRTHATISALKKALSQHPHAYP